MKNNYIHFESVTDTAGKPGRIVWKDFCEANKNPQALPNKMDYPLFGNEVPKEGMTKTTAWLVLLIFTQ